MKATIGMVGVPIETVFVRTDDDYLIDVIEAYTPGATKNIREFLNKADESRAQGINLIDLGELSFGITAGRNYYHREVSEWERKSLTDITLDMLLEERGKLLAKKDDFDVLLCIGLSHFGALLLYEDSDFVVRADCHGDYFKKDKEKHIGANYASYMNTVERKFSNARILNYGVRTNFGSETMDFYGEMGDINCIEHVNANHFDIDVDCFAKELMMSSSRNCSNLLPAQIESMAAEARPRKIGIWEYRINYDSGNGRKFIENVVFS